MYYVYVLLCEDNKRSRKNFYVGVTGNLKKRLTEHRSKVTQTTKSFDHLELIYYEACLNKTDAVVRERQLKTGFGRGYINRRLENYLKSLRD